MHIEQFREFCLSLPGVTEHLPFDENTLVFKVMNKMFALGDIAEFESINLKCDPERALRLREEYEEVKPGYHMNKNHWNTVSVKGHLQDDFLKDLILHSYDLVVSKLTQKQKNELRDLA
ncbi:MAG TPA: MmcQ-like protein [Balneolaceae bacterium]|nr:MmcQ-like protein [Balneolaceae bacterium]|tara:strand:- start:107820 stop:108176 length:357 start_codon:yes stop_codon:yes gene_type:complete